VIELPDGKIVAAGVVNNRQLALARYAADGRLDTSFGSKGMTNSLIGSYRMFVAGLGRQGDGKLIVGGYLQSVGGQTNAYLFRLNTHGAVDNTFGFDMPAFTGTFHALGVQQDDKIILVGRRDTTGFLAVRAGPDGALDTGFGDGGTVVVPIGGQSAVARCVKVLDNGKILLGGSCTRDGNSDFTLVRLNADGTLDTSFGSNGIVMIDMGGDSDSCHSICLQGTDGGFVAGGSTNAGGSSKIALAHFLENGALEPSFGPAGKVVTPLMSLGECTCVLARTDGTLIAIGYAQTPQNVRGCLEVRYHSNGSLDTAFGQDGQMVHSMGALGGNVSTACLGNAGKVVAAGSMLFYDVGDFAIVRMTASGGTDEGFRGGISARQTGGVDSPLKSAIQSGGRVLACGGISSGGSSRMGVVRYDSSGQADASFGSQGVAAVDFGVSGSSIGRSLAVMSDDKVIVVGSSGSQDQFAVARFLANGVLDNTFGSGGRVRTSVGTATESAYDVALLANGKILVAGTARNGSNNDFALVRYLSNGTLDAQFGIGGKVLTAVGPGDDHANSMVVQPDGKIILAGRASTETDADFALVRYNADGSLDETFGTGGKIMTPVGAGWDQGVEVVLQPDGKILLAGNSSQVPYQGVAQDMGFVRYLPDGALDPAFGNGGKVLRQVGLTSSMTSLSLQADGRVVVVGRATSPLGERVPFGMLVMRMEDDGSLDTGFGDNGAVVTHILGSGTAGLDVVSANDGAIQILGAVSNSPSPTAWLLARYQMGPLLPVLATLPPQNIFTVESTLRGEVNPNGSATTVQFEYGTSTAFGHSASIVLTPADGAQWQSVSSLVQSLTPNTTYHYRLKATNAAGTRSTASSSFTTLSLQGGWRQQHFGLSSNTGNAADTFDFDSDGLPNLLEWASGLDPTVGSQLQHSTVVREGELEFTYPRSVEALNAGTRFMVEWSDSLVSTSWSTSGVIQTVLLDNGVTQQVKAVLPAGQNGRRFVRLKVEAP